ncbi:MAG: hypothetical protein LBQ43_00825 [Holosporales bacterium]|jgi:chromosome segregation ATPase|nr:hypothetical protein [Holosporales bacterium]
MYQIRLAVEAEQKDATIGRLQSEVEAAEARIRNSLAQKRASDDRVTHMEQEIIRIKEDLDTVKACHKDVSDQMIVLAAQAEQKDTTIGRLQSELETAEARIRDLCATNDKLTADFAKEGKERTSLYATIGGLSSYSRDVSRERDFFEEQLSEKNSDIDQMSHQLSQAQKSADIAAANMRDSMEQSMRQIAGLTQENQNLKNELANAIAELSRRK